MALRIIDCEQNSLEWFEARCGLATSSRFSDVLAKGKGGAPSKTRATYMRELAAERVLGEPSDVFVGNRHTERGQYLEPEARDLYEFRTDRKLQQVGFVLDDVLRAGASPDSLVDDDGMLEIKTRLPHLHVEVLLAGELPSDHKAQVQGALMITGRAWMDYMSYCPRLPPLILRVARDEAYIAELRVAIQDFNAELDQMVAKVGALS